jgi:serpin B
VINDWVAEQTRDRILNLLPPGSIDAAVVAVITNALYFKAPWALPFDEDLTVDGLFHLLDGSKTTVPMIRQVEWFRYAEGEGYQALEMDYREHELSMVFLLPAEGRFQEFEQSLTESRLAEILGALEEKEVAVSIPSFTYSSPSISMRDALISLGMVVPFYGGADFTGMVESRDIYIDDAFHKTFIALDEKGTEAAAATAIIFRETSINLEGEYEFTADRPFLYLIRDRVTGTILFIGTLINPDA